MELKYSLNQKPPFHHLMIYGLQWLILSIPNVLTIAMLAKLQFADDIVLQTLYLQKVYIVLGLTMLAQAWFGHRMPLVVGPAAVLIVGILSAASEGFGAVYTAIAVGGAILLVISVSGLLKKITRLFSPRVIITILGLIAMTLAPVIINLVFGSGNALFNYIFLLGAILHTFVIDRFLRGIGKSFTVIILTIGGTIAYYLFNEAAPLPAFNYSIGWDDMFITPEFNPAVILSFLICFFALTINELGSVQSVRDMVGDKVEERRVSAGCATTGLGNLFSGLVGVIGPVDFSISPGIIASTRCASRFTVIPCGIGLVLCALFPSMVSWLTLLPDAVIGVVLGYIIILQLAAAFNMMMETKSVSNFEHALTISIPLASALLVAIAPAEVAAAFPESLRPILTNGFVVGVLFVVFLEHIVFSRKSRKQKS